MSVTSQLAQFAAQTDWSRVPHATKDMLNASLFDWMSVGLAGRNEPVSQIVRAMLGDEGGTAQASVFGAPVQLPARAAALANGTISHALDYDDTHFAHIGHPSVAVFPAALAMAEAKGADSDTFCAAALVGIEVSIRVGMWLGRAHYQTGFHQTATAGAFGAAAAAGHILGFNATQMANALGLVATRASGLKSQFGTMAKPFNAGLAASNGVEAAVLVARGFLPNPDGLEAAQGFGPTHAGEAIESALDGLGTTWVFDQISHKFHACCHGLHASLEAMAALPRVTVDKIEKINVRTHPRWMSVCNIAKPATGLEAKFSYGLVLSMAAHGISTAALESYSDQTCLDPSLIRCRDKVVVTSDETLTETEAVVMVQSFGGSAQEKRFDLEAQVSLEDRIAKLRDKSAALLGQAQAEALWQVACEGAPGDIGAALRRG